MRRRSSPTDLRTAVDIPTSEAGDSHDRHPARGKVAGSLAVAAGLIWVAGAVPRRKPGVFGLLDTQQDVKNIVPLLLREAFLELNPHTAIVEVAFDTPPLGPVRKMLRGNDVRDREEQEYEKSGEFHGDFVANNNNPDYTKLIRRLLWEKGAKHEVIIVMSRDIT